MPAVIEAVGRSRASLYVDVSRGVLTPPVRVGANCVGWPADEINAIIGARIAGRDDEAIRALVASLVDARQQAA
jgi:prophage regulatory protein